MATSKSKPQASLLRRMIKWPVLFAIGFISGMHLYAAALKWAPVPGTILMVQRGVAGEDVRRKPKGLDAISPHLVRAVIAAEDTGFCEHKGVDTEAIKKALDERAQGKKLRGASTITQQTAKNVFFWNGGGLARKGGEAWMATVVDTLWGKRRVMEVYLNVAEWGDGLFGAEAAAQARFGKSAANLTEGEAALLAAVLPSPNKWRVDPPGPYVTKRAGTLRARMRTVRAQGLDSCVLGEHSRDIPGTFKGQPATKPAQKRPAAPKVQKRDEPIVRDAVTAPVNNAPAPIAPPAGVNAETDAELDAVLNAAEEAFNAQPEDAPTGAPPPQPENEPPRPAETTRPVPNVSDAAQPEEAASRPLELRPLKPLTVPEDEGEE